MSQVDLPSPPDDPPVTINLEAAIAADPDSPAGIGEMLIGLATCAEHYGHHRSMASCPGISEDQRLDEMKEMNQCRQTTKRWLEEISPRLKRLRPQVIEDRIPEAGPFLVDAGIRAEELCSVVQFDWSMFPELRQIALESYKRPGSPGRDPLDNSLLKFSNDAGAVRSRLESLAATLRGSYADKLRQVATSRIKSENVAEGAPQPTTDEVTDGEPREPDSYITVRQASEIWCRSEAWWRVRVGDWDGAPIRLQGTGKNGAKLFSYLDADQFARSQDAPIERRKPKSS